MKQDKIKFHMNRATTALNMRRLIAPLCMLLLASGISALAKTPQEAVNEFVNSASVAPGSTSVMVSDLKDGRILASYNASTPLIPASIMKSITIASLSETLDVDKPIITKCHIDGKVDSDGVLNGNIIVEGAGDPSINSGVWPVGEDFVKEIVDAVKNLGVKRILGKVKVEQDYFKGPAVHPSWGSGDLSRSYGTGSHAFNFANNASGKASVKDPSAVFIAQLKRQLNSAGISIEDGVPASGGRKLLLEHKSPALKEIMRSCMMRSDNLYAESMLRRYGKEKGGDGSTSDAARREMEMWKKSGADMEGVQIADGSGLSRSNRVTARFMEDVLRQKANDVEYVSFFPLAGQEGTLRSLLKDTALDSYIAMKTGSMTGVQCYAGYKLDDDFAPTHVVVIIINNFKGSRGDLRSGVEKMLLEIFNSDK